MFGSNTSSAKKLKLHGSQTALHTPRFTYTAAGDEETGFTLQQYYFHEMHKRQKKRNRNFGAIRNPTTFLTTRFRETNTRVGVRHTTQGVRQTGVVRSWYTFSNTPAPPAQRDLCPFTSLGLPFPRAGLHTRVYGLARQGRYKSKAHGTYENILGNFARKQNENFL